MGLRLFLVTLAEGESPVPANGIELVTFRELAAVVAEAPYVAAEPSSAEIQRFERVVASFAAARPVLPAPVGVIFRSRETLWQWLELHYVALSDALSYVEDRVEARVHIARADAKPDEREAGADLAAAAAESFRVMRRGAVAWVPLKTEHMTGIVLGAAFLIDKDLWKAFTVLVAEERDARKELRVELSGPWPPYDFVRMQFGG